MKRNRITEQKIDLKIDNEYLLSLLRKMIAVNSVIGFEEELAIFLSEEAKKLGLTVILDEVEKGRPNLYATHSFTENGKTLTFNGHLDTVEVCEGWESDPFKPIEKEGKLFGLGSSDMKAGLACGLAAFKALIDSGEDIKGKFVFTAVVDEEGYSKGARRMLESSFGSGKTDGIIIAEPYFGDSKANCLPLGATGKVLYKITVKGVSAHGFSPEKGVNAVNDAARIIVAIENNVGGEKEKESQFLLPTHKEFGQGSLCVLKIEGGYKTYSVLVPDLCEIILNRLTVPGETKQSVVKDLQEFIGNLNLKSEVSLEIIPPFYLSYQISESNDLVQSLKSSYHEILGKYPIMGMVRTITDANVFTAEGKIKTVLFGPKGGNIHGANEFVDIECLEKVALVYANTFVHFQTK